MGDLRGTCGKPEGLYRLRPPQACRARPGFLLVRHRDQRVLVCDRARQDRAASRLHRAAAMGPAPGKVPRGPLGTHSGQRDHRPEPRIGPRLAPAIAACPRTLAPDTNGQAMILPGRSGRPGVRSARSTAGVLKPPRCGPRILMASGSFSRSPRRPVGFGKFAPVWVSERGLEHGNR